MMEKTSDEVVNTVTCLQLQLFGVSISLFEEPLDMC